jgi:flagellar basal-body rod protein FlgG
MSRMMTQAAVTMGQLQNKLDVISNNMANTNTTGYKTQNANFSSLLFQQMNNPPADEANEQNRATSDGIRIGAGSYLSSTNPLMTMGTIQTTDRNLDAALVSDNQFFTITSEDGQEQYTRAGNFYLQPQNDGTVALTTADGDFVNSAEGPIALQADFDSITINDRGEIVVGRNGVNAVEANLAITAIDNPRVLTRTGDNNFSLADPALARAIGQDEVELQTGSLEGSNVDLSQQMTAMINTQRAYQFNARSISMSDQMSGLINQIR